MLDTKSPREKRKGKKYREEIERKELHALKVWTQSIGKNYRGCERELRKKKRVKKNLKE